MFILVAPQLYFELFTLLCDEVGCECVHTPGPEGPDDAHEAEDDSGDHQLEDRLVKANSPASTVVKPGDDRREGKRHQAERDEINAHVPQGAVERGDREG